MKTGTQRKRTFTVNEAIKETVKGTPTYRFPRLLAATVTAVALGGCALNPFHDREEPVPVANARAYQDDGLAQAREAFGRGNYGIAIGRLQRYLDRHPRSIAALNGLGASFDKLGRYEVARRYYFRALDLNPDAPVTLTNIAYSYIMEDRQEEAVPLLELALHHQPDYRHAAENLQLARASLAGHETPTFAMLATLAMQKNSVDGTAEETPAPANREVEANLSADENADEKNADEIPTFAMLASLARQENLADGTAPPASTPVTSVTLPDKDREADRTREDTELPRVFTAPQDESPEPVYLNAVADVTEANVTPIFASTRPRRDKVADEEQANGTATESDEIPEATTGEISTAPERRLTASSPTFTPEGTLSELRLEVSNGNGVTGMAARTRAWLNQRGSQVVRLTNADSFGYRDTVLYFATGNRTEAEVLAALLPLDGVRLEAVDVLAGGVDARLRIGHDFVPYDEQISTGGQLAHNTR